MKQVSIAILALVVGALTACGGTPDPSTTVAPPASTSAPVAAKPVTNSGAQTLSKQYADTTVQAGKSLSTTSSSPSSATGAAFTLGSLGASMVNAVKSTTAASTLGATSTKMLSPMLLSTMLLSPTLLSPTMLAPKSGDCSTTGGYSVVGDTITYDCTYGTSGYNILLTGQIVANSSSVNFKNFKLTYDYAAGATTLKYAIVYNGGFTYTNTTLNGKFDVSIDYNLVSSGTTRNYFAATSTYYDNIDYTGCASGAKSGSITATSKGDGTVYRTGTVKIVYGPACGTSSVYSD